MGGSWQHDEHDRVGHRDQLEQRKRFPGIGMTNNFDTAVFNSNPANSTPVVDANRNLQNITFDTANVGALNLSGSILKVTAGGVIQTAATVTNDEMISAPLTLEGDYSVLSRSDSPVKLTLSGIIDTAVNAVLTLGGGNSANNTVSGMIRDGLARLGITKSDAGRWIVSNGTNSFTGNTTINAGALNVANGALGPVSKIVFGGGTLEYATGNTQDLSSRIVNSTGPITIATNGNNVAFVSSLADTNVGGLTKLGAGTLTLSNTNNYTGPTTLASGILSVNTIADGLTPSSLGASSNAAANLMFNGGTLQYTGANGSTDRDFTLNGSGSTIEVNNAAATLTFTGVGVGTGSIIKSGPGTVVLGGVNTYTGNTMVNAGVLQTGNNNVNATLNNGDYSVAGGAQLVFSRNVDNVAFLNQSISGAGDVFLRAKAPAILPGAPITPERSATLARQSSTTTLTLVEHGSNEVFGWKRTICSHTPPFSTSNRPRSSCAIIREMVKQSAV